MSRWIWDFSHRKFSILPGYEQADLEQELLDVLWLCCQNYDPDRGAKFSTYYIECANRRFLDLHKAASAQKRVGDYERVWLDDDSVRMAVEETLLSASAEDSALARMNVVERLRRQG